MGEAVENAVAELAPRQVLDLTLVGAHRPVVERVDAFAATTLTRSKRALDVVVASALLVLSLPLFLLVAVVVRRDGGPVLFNHSRVGTGGKRIRVTKFRTMAVDAEERLLADAELYASYLANGFKLPSGQDPRLTPVGRFLRASSLDELPQLLCVLRGDMTMVGPRPIIESELAEYSSRGAEAAYLSARPGLTGLWQVSGRSHVGYDERVALDLAYLSNPSTAADIRILVRTVPAVLRRHGAC